MPVVELLDKGTTVDGQCAPISTVARAIAAGALTADEVYRLPWPFLRLPAQALRCTWDDLLPVSESLSLW